MLFVTPQIQIAEEELQFSYARSSGPGGQNVNKVNSKAVLRWTPSRSESIPPAVLARFQDKFGGKLTLDGELIISSQRYRDQGRNTLDCLDKLREMLCSVAVAPKKRRPTKPSRAARERRYQSKQAQSRKKTNRRSGFED